METSIIKLQAMWRGRQTRRRIHFICPQCHAVTVGENGSIFSKRGELLYIRNFEPNECDTCFAERLRTMSPIQQDQDYDSLFLQGGKGHYCGDWLCPGDCGILACGCIDVCRRNCDGWSRW